MLTTKAMVSFDGSLNTAISEANKPVLESKQVRGLQKLSDSEVIVVKALHHIAHWSNQAIHEKFDSVSISTISQILMRTTRKSVQLTHMTKIPELFYELAGENYRGVKVRGTK